MRTRRPADADRRRADLRLPRAGRVQLQTAIPVRYRRGTPAPAWRREVRLTLRAEALELGALAARALASRRVAGLAALTLRAGGELRDPRLDAELTWRGARLDEILPVDGSLTLAVRPGQSTEAVIAVRRDRPLAAVRARLAASLAPLLAGHARRWLEDASPAAEVRVMLAPTTPATLRAFHPALADAPRGREGAVAGQLDLGGSLQRPRLEARLQVDRLVLTPGARPTQLALVATSHSGPRGLETDAAVTLDARPLLDLRATVGTAVAALLAGRDPTTAPLAARVTLRETERGALGGLLLTRQQAGGTLSGRATATGSIGHPAAEAMLAVRGARFEGVAAGDFGVAARLAARGDQVNVAAQLQLDQTAGADGQRGSLRGDVALTLARRGRPRSRLRAPALHPRDRGRRPQARRPRRAEPEGLGGGHGHGAARGGGAARPRHAAQGGALAAEARGRTRAPRRLGRPARRALRRRYGDEGARRTPGAPRARGGAAGRGGGRHAPGGGRPPVRAQRGARHPRSASSSPGASTSPFAASSASAARPRGTSPRRCWSTASRRAGCWWRSSATPASEVWT